MLKLKMGGGKNTKKQHWKDLAKQDKNILSIVEIWREKIK